MVRQASRRTFDWEVGWRRLICCPARELQRYHRCRAGPESREASEREARMESSAFRQAERALESGGEQAVFDVLAQTFMQDKDYAKLFQLRVLRKRFELGLPLIQNGPGEEVPADKRPEYEQAFIQAAREAGELFLARERHSPGLAVLQSHRRTRASRGRHRAHGRAREHGWHYRDCLPGADPSPQGFRIDFETLWNLPGDLQRFSVSNSGRPAGLHWSAVAKPAPRPSQQLEEGHCAKGGSGTGDGKHL